MGGGLALNQLLVVMDGIDNPPFFKKFFTNKTNTFLDGIYIVPRRISGKSLRLPAAKPRKEQIYFIGATNVPIDRLDPALTRPGRMGRHVWFRTPTKHDRLDILDLYIGKVSHDPDLDSPKRRDEIARITNGYSPAMIEQVTSMALTIAHHSGRNEFVWDDLVESITTLESGTAVGHRVRPRGEPRDGDPRGRSRDRRSRVHDRHRVDAALDPDARRLARSPPGAREGGALQPLPERALRPPRLGSRRDGRRARVLRRELDRCRRRRDVRHGQAAWMVGSSAMGTQPFAVTPKEGETEDEARERVLDRFEGIGLQIMNRTGGGMMSGDPISGILSDPSKRKVAAQIARPGVRRRAQPRRCSNRDGVEKIADAVLERKELFGDELVDLLDSVGLRLPEIDYADESSWPPPFFSISAGRRRPPVPAEIAAT